MEWGRGGGNLQSIRSKEGKERRAGGGGQGGIWGPRGQVTCPGSSSKLEIE